MLVSCSYCGGQHQRGQVCQAKPRRIKQTNHITRFRSSAAWTRKSLEIRERDKFLCQVCKLDSKYIFKNLEVHHISSLENNWENRLNNCNLVTLCKQCHELAENGKIESSLLFSLAEKNERAL